MNEFELRTTPARHTATLSLLVAAAVGIVLGWSVGVPLATVLTVCGGLSIAVGTWGLNEPSALRQAGGSILAVAGTLSIVAGTNGLPSLVPISVGVAVTLVGIDATVGFDRARDRTLGTWARANVAVVVVGSAIVAGGWLGAVPVLPWLHQFWLGVVGRWTLLDLVVVQCLLVATSFLLSAAIPVLDRWAARTDEAEQSVLASLDRVSLTPAGMPDTYVAALGVQVVLAFVPQTARSFERFFGPVLEPVLGTGLLQHGLLVVVVGLCALIVVGKLQRLVVVVLGGAPADRLALAAGGVLATTAVVAIEIGKWAGVVDISVDGALPAAPVGIAPVALLALTGAMLGVAVVAYVARTLANHRAVPTPGSGYALGSGLLFGTAIVGSLHSLPAVGLFVGVAGAILCWDLGSHAIGIGRQLGQRARTDRAEFVHVTATTLVLGGAVVLVTVLHSVVPMAAPTAGPRAESRAVLGLGALVVAMVGFLVAAYLRQRER
ncbi:hypothetical protein GOC74_14690 [Halomicrobium mukohataei]|uniref:Uncharacterized protein n=1 Tax=Halomicrobium mukohataei TaxID=57705 RepID=A0A847UCJ4_9EURY|nr:hypothetical protein [Halomicrobium mukohataei]NLV11175.1 hypothetical protein [Halomicrobium mukohataei]